MEQVCINILRKIGVRGLSSYEIVDCHRLRKRNKNETANVIIRFVNRKRAYQALDNCHNLHYLVRDYGYLTISENLCPKYRQIYEKCLKLHEQGKINHIWTYNGIRVKGQ